MSKTPNTLAMVLHMLEALETPSKSLTKWEEGFIGSITEITDRGVRLTPAQFETLERLYTEKTE